VFEIRRLAVSLFLVGLLPPGSAPAQARWVIDKKSSLAWWQFSPHMNHLWATTCPAEPSWRPGEGRSSGWSIGGLLMPVDADLATADTIQVPLYPRYEAHDVCTESVDGSVAVADTVRWRGITGTIVVQAESLITGQKQRDNYTHQKILETAAHPEIRFEIDSVVEVVRQADTLTGVAVGVLTLHGVTKVMRGGVIVWPEAGGLRVQGRFRIPARWVVDEYNMSRVALGLGVGFKIWQDLFMGVDLLMRRSK
jgi:hypothetical protein